jgi:PelA/Pel-15E family pectate lyase
VCTGQDKSASTVISLKDFEDSAHHWYDIQDEKRIIDPLPDQNKYTSNEITNIADNILLFQKSNGGWPKNYDMQAILTKEQREFVTNNHNELNTTFDNGATHSHINYLAKAHAQIGDKRYRDGCIRGIDFVLAAQYQNGGWPQFYPDTSGYRKYITFNDGAMIGIMRTLQKIILHSPEFAFVGIEQYEKCKKAFEHGIECILKCQIVQRGTLSAWCQQHDNRDFQPRNARTFEPASVCSMESVDIVKFLMSIDKPNDEIINAVRSAIKWFERVNIIGIRQKIIKAPLETYQYHKADFDKIVVSDPKAPPIWTRFYELGTNRPLFCNRDGKVVYSLAEVERERRTGYGWYNYEPAAALKEYKTWEQRIAKQR